MFCHRNYDSIFLDKKNPRTTWCGKIEGAIYKLSGGNLYWFILQFINSSLSSSSGGGVAYAAHIGGFITGIILILFFNNKKIKKTRNIYKGPWEQ